MTVSKSAASQTGVAKVVQLFLKNQGIYNGKLDGIIDTLTKNAWELYCSSVGLMQPVQRTFPSDLNNLPEAVAKWYKSYRVNALKEKARQQRQANEEAKKNAEAEEAKRLEKEAAKAKEKAEEKKKQAEDKKSTKGGLFSIGSKKDKKDKKEKKGS